MTVTSQDRSTIVFDFDDTIVVSRTDRGEALLDALESFGTPAVHGLDEHWGLPFRNLVNNIAPAVASQYNEFLLHYSDILAARCPTPCPGVVDVLPTLARTHRLFIHSASESLLVRTDLQSLGLLHLFDFVCGSDWQPSPKPDASSFLALAELLTAARSSFAHAWYVGDAPTDLEIARAAGLRFVGAGYTPSSEEAFLHLGVPEAQIVRDLRQLPEVLQRPNVTSVL